MLEYLLDAEQLGRLVSDLDPVQVGTGVLIGSSAALVLERYRHRPKRDHAGELPAFKAEVVLLDHADTARPMTPDAAERALAHIVHQHFVKIARLFEIVHADMPQTRASAWVVGDLLSKDDPLTVIFEFGGERIIYRASVDELVHGSIFAAIVFGPDGHPSGAKAAWAGVIVAMVGVGLSQLPDFQPDEAPQPEVHTYVCYLDMTVKNITKDAQVNSVVKDLILDDSKDSERIANIQYCLTQAGYDVGSDDGVIGPKFQGGTDKLVETLGTRRDLEAERLWRSESFVRAFVYHTIDQYEQRIDQALANTPELATLKRSRR